MSGGVASLPMYDLPAVRWATDAFWTAVAAALRQSGMAAPASLDRRAAYASVWREPGLLLTQTCGYPFVTALHGRVRLVATPIYDAPGCEGACYRSWLMVRATDPARTLAELRGRRVAFNATDSQSGYNALRALVAPLAHGGRFFATGLATGSHAASLAAVAKGRADLCAVDCVTWALLARHQPARTHGLRCIGQTETTPTLPLVTAAATDDRALACLRAALQAAMAAPELASARMALLLRGLAPADEATYAIILAQERRALAQGYPHLAG